MVFMLIYYRGSGINADVALILNLVILLGFWASGGRTLTLPGIAGVILTIGMGVDSNVLIFESIREEVRPARRLGGRGSRLRARLDHDFRYSRHHHRVRGHSVHLWKRPGKRICNHAYRWSGSESFYGGLCFSGHLRSHLDRLKAGELVSI